MSDAEKNAQERELGKIAGDAAKAEEFVPNTNPPAPPEPPPSQGSMQVAGYMLMAVNVACGLMASKRGSHWLLNDSDNAQLQIAIARVAEKYVVIDFNSPVMNLAAVAGAIFLPRLAIEFAQPVVEMERSENGD